MAGERYRTEMHASLAGCLSPDEIAEFVAGELSPPAIAAFEGHLDTCPRCRRVVSAVCRADGATGRGSASSLAATLVAGAAVWPGETAGDTEPPEPSLPTGTAIGRYTVLERIGAGGMGVVYAVLDPELDRKVAVKLLRAGEGSASRRAELEYRLVGEARAMAQLAHPNVVTVFEIGRFGDQLFLAMEFVEGHTLRDWLAEKPRSWREIVEVFAAAGEGLATVHAAGLVHRDFKPTNVLVGRDGRPRVTDFGLVQDGSPGTARGAIAGTPYYMSPEQFRGEPADARSDQFSFCVALFAALHGVRPFEADALGDL